jgi:Family of unknown function (DUF5343)
MTAEGVRVDKNVPYMSSVKNVPGIFAKIKGAGTPPKFTTEFLRANLGFPSSNDRTVIRVLKALGFLSPDSVPTARYNEFRDVSGSGRAIAAGLREGWSEVFLSNRTANYLSATQLTELFKNVTGAGEAVAVKMATTFKALASLTAASDWVEATPSALEPALESPDAAAPAGGAATVPPPSGPLLLHHDIHIHLPATSDVSVYTAIFRAIRSELRD